MLIFETVQLLLVSAKIELQFLPYVFESIKLFAALEGCWQYQDLQAVTVQVRCIQQISYYRELLQFIFGGVVFSRNFDGIRK